MQKQDWALSVRPGAGDGWKMTSSILYTVRTIHGFVMAWVGGGESYFVVILNGVEHRRLIDREYNQRGVTRAVNQWLKELTGA